MSKKIETNLADRAIQLLDQQNEQAKAATNNFYDDSILVNLTPSSAKQPLATLLTLAKQPPAPQVPSQEQLLDACLNTRINVKQGKPGNIEIQFNMS